MFQKLPQGTRQKLKSDLTNRYAALKRLKEQDRDLFEVERERITIEDGVFDALAQFRTAKSDDKKQQAREALRQRVAELADNRQADAHSPPRPQAKAGGEPRTRGQSPARRDR